MISGFANTIARTRFSVWVSRIELIWVGMFLVSSPLLLAGCSSPKQKSNEAVRKERIESYWKEFRAREQASLGQMHDTLALEKKMGLRHAEKLKKTSKFVELRFQKHAEEWRDGRSERKSFLKRIFKGNRESAREAWTSVTP